MQVSQHCGWVQGSKEPARLKARHLSALLASSLVVASLFDQTDPVETSSNFGRRRRLDSNGTACSRSAIHPIAGRAAGVPLVPSANILAWPAVGSGSGQVDYDVDIAPCCFGVRARLMCFIHQGLGDFPLHTRQADVEASLEEASAVSQAQIDFSLDGQANRENDLSLAGCKRDGAFEAGRPGSRKQLLRIGADARGAGG